jgi:rhomboid family GlyGly-CTERM serine protease
LKFVADGIDWRIPGILCVFGLLAAIAGSSADEWLRFDRELIAGGQAWRLVSGHLVHLGWTHLLLNLAGLLLVWFLVGSELNTRQWLVVLGICFAAVSGGLWYLDADLRWYVGLSGVLHGLLIAGLLQSFSTRSPETVAVTLALCAKLAYEQLQGPLPGSQDIAGGPIAVNAHLYGFVAGGLAGILIRRKVHKRATDPGAKTGEKN